MEITKNEGSGNSAAERASDDSAMIAEVLAEARAEGDLEFSPPSVNTSKKIKFPGDDQEDEATEEESLADAKQSADAVASGDSKEPSDGLQKLIDEAVSKNDLVGLAETLKLTPAQAAKLFKISKIDFIALRDDRRETKKNKADLDKATKEAETKFKNLQEKLLSAYGEPDAIRKAWNENDFDTTVSGIEKFLNCGIHEFMREYHKHFKGMKTEDLAKERRLRELEAKEASRNGTEKKPEEAKKPEAARVAEAMNWIGDGIKSDKFASYPNIKQLCYDVLVRDNKKGVKTPLAALAVVKAELAAFGIKGEEKSTPKKKDVISKSPPRNPSSGKFSKAQAASMDAQDLIAGVLSEMSPGDYWK